MPLTVNTKLIDETVTQPAVSCADSGWNTFLAPHVCLLLFSLLDFVKM